MDVAELDALLEVSQSTSSCSDRETSLPVLSCTTMPPTEATVEKAKQHPEYWSEHASGSPIRGSWESIKADICILEG